MQCFREDSKSKDYVRWCDRESGRPPNYVQFPPIIEVSRANKLTSAPQNGIVWQFPLGKINTMKLHSALCAFFLFPMFCSGQSTAPAKSTAPLATVDGQPITEEDLLPQVQGQLRPLRDQEYQIKRKGLDYLIGQ